MTDLVTYLELKYLASTLTVAETSADQYRIAVRQLNRYHQQPVLLTDLSDGLVIRFMKWLKALGRSERTANNKRQAILTLWRHAANINKLIPPPPRIPKLEEPRRIVQAWTVDQLAELLGASDHAEPIFAVSGHGVPRLLWDKRHWRALILVIYDTSHRIGALLDATRDCVDFPSRSILLKAEWTKQKSDTWHRLHPDTLAALAALPKSDSPLLFPFPLRRRAIWPAFRAILEAAKLRATRKDLFHKLRRTSFTYVFALLGESAALEQAGHATNMTASYLDRQLLAKLQNRPSPVDVLPRPKAR